MTSKCILMLDTHSLLVEGVKSFLDTMDEFEVASSLFTNDIALVQEIRQLKPDVVIMDDETITLIEPVQLLELFRIRPCLRLIVLDTQISRMDIYDKRELTISHPRHLIEALV